MKIQLRSGSTRKSFGFEAKTEPNFRRLPDFLIDFPEKFHKDILKPKSSILE
jgi:hypothetical protein